MLFFNGTKADVQLHTVIERYPILISAVNLKANDSTVIIANKAGQKSDFIISYLMLANNLCSSCLDIGFEYPSESSPLNRVKQLKSSNHNKKDLFYLEIIFALDNKNRPYVGVSNIMKVNVNSVEDLNIIREYFNSKSLDSIKMESDKNLEIISNQNYKSEFLSKYDESGKDVLPIEAAIEIRKNNFLYRGIETEVHISVPEKKIRL